MQAATDLSQVRGWLCDQPGQVCLALGVRAALRVFPLVRLVEPGDKGAGPVALAVGRALLSSGVAAVTPTDELRWLAEQARAAAEAKVVTAMRAARDAGPPGYDVARDPRFLAARAACVADEAGDGEASYIAACAAFHAGGGDNAAYEALLAASGEDTGLDPDTLMTAPISVPEAFAEALGGFGTGKQDLMTIGQDWVFWAEWYLGAMAGFPLDWAVQEDIARLDDDGWRSGADVIARRIARLRARATLAAELEALEARISGELARAEEVDDDDAPDAKTSAGFAAIRLIRRPLSDLAGQLEAPMPAPYLIQRATTRLSGLMVASGKWLGRPADASANDLVRMIGKSGGVPTAHWLNRAGPRIRAVIAAGEDWARVLPP